MTSAKVNFTLPSKGFKIPLPPDEKGRVFLIEGMGEGRFRIHAAKTPPRKK